MSKPSSNPPGSRTAMNKAGHLLSQALEQHRSGQLARAAAMYEALLKAHPRHFDALHLLGVIALQKKDYQRAANLIGNALAVKPDDASALSNRGIALKHLGQLDAAIASYDQALALNPRYAEAHSNRGIALAELERLEEAVASQDQAIALKPDYAAAFGNRGVALAGLGRLDEAMASYERAIALQPDYAEAFSNRGLALKQLKRLDEAVASFDCAIAIRPGDPAPHYNRGVALAEIGRPEDAMASYDRAIALRPDHADAYSNRGVVLAGMKRFDEAIASYALAAALKPDHAESQNNCGVALRELKRFDEAIACFERAIVIKPDYAEAFNNLGVTYAELKRMDAAIASYDRALALRPEYADACWNKSLALLIRGDFSEGWPLYEWRFRIDRVDTIITTRYHASLPAWDGAPFRGHLLVLPEQGVGDEIFYLGMLHELAPLAGSVTVAVDQRLIPLLCRSFPELRFLPSDTINGFSGFDAQIHMGSLGRLFRGDRAAFGKVRRGYLRACPEKTHVLRSRIAGGGKLVCGISWRSKNRDFGEQKSTALTEWMPLLALEGWRFVDLQYGETAAELLALRQQSGIAVDQIGDVDNLNDLDGLSALICACDVVVTVSNTTAHLAAALGQPVFVLLPQGAGLLYYWQLDRADSPWYPGVRLYRQDSPGDWSAVLAQVSADLLALPRTLPPAAVAD